MLERPSIFSRLAWLYSCSFVRVLPLRLPLDVLRLRLLLDEAGRLVAADREREPEREPVERARLLVARVR